MRPFITAALTLCIVIASAGIASAQQLARSPVTPGTRVLAVQPQLPDLVVVPTHEGAPRSDLDQRIMDARFQYERDRILGTGLIAAGAAVVLGSLADWAARTEFGMDHGTAAIMVGGMNLVFWGTDRHRLARQSLEYARALEARAARP